MKFATRLAGASRGPVASFCKHSIRVHQISTSRRLATTTQAAQETTAPPSADEIRVRAEVTRRIKDLGRQGKAREAVGELAAMARLGIQPDTLSGTALLDACMRCKKIDMAESVFEELFTGGLLVPDEVRESAFFSILR